MATFIKDWPDGGSLTATYQGSGNGSAVFSASSNEGLDRETKVYFVDASRKVSVEKSVIQQGRREIYSDLILADGGTFNVIKNGL